MDHKKKEKNFFIFIGTLVYRSIAENMLKVIDYHHRMKVQLSCNTQIDLKSHLSPFLMILLELVMFIPVALHDLIHNPCRFSWTEEIAQRQVYHERTNSRM